MPDAKKQVEQITARDADFAQWYTDVVKKAELIDYTETKGFLVLRPYAYAIWENIRKVLDGMFKQSGHENVYMPMLIPESLLQKEKDLVRGFAPEVAWVTQGGSEELPERLCIRPTSETLFCEHYNHIIHSHRDLPKKYNQWCSVVRWEKTTRPFLRHREFLWQEGHTAHANAEEARIETVDMLETYADLCENYLAIPVLKGRKTEAEKFPGAEETYAVECMMHDGRGLQAGTTHYFGDRFARAFDIMYTDRDNSRAYVHQTSWGVSTRLMGGIIMAHGDDSGLILPPKIAPTQVMVIPVAMHKDGVLEKAREVKKYLSASGIRAGIDISDQTPGWKFAEYEMKGVPLRLEIGPRDIENGSCVLARRDTGEKVPAKLDGLADTIKEILEKIHAELFARAERNMKSRTGTAQTLGEMKELSEKRVGFVKTMWCGDEACEDKVREETGMKSRCMPFAQEPLGDTCAVCGKKAASVVVWGLQY